MTDLDHLESLARKAAEDGNFVAKANCLMALQDACSPEVILRLCAIARAAEKGLVALERSMGRMDEYSYRMARDDRLEHNPIKAIAALRAALGKER